jgi:hypothetical protein
VTVPVMVPRSVFCANAGKEKQRTIDAIPKLKLRSFRSMVFPLMDTNLPIGQVSSLFASQLA